MTPITRIFLVLKGPYHDQPTFYMLKHLFCRFQRHFCCPDWIFDSPRIKQKLKFLALVRHVKLAIRNNRWHVKKAIRNNKWHAKMAIRNNKWHAKQAIHKIVPDSQFCVPPIVPDSRFRVPLNVPDSLFYVPPIVPDSHFYVPHQCEEFQFLLDCGTIKDPIRTTNMSLNSAK